MEVVLISVLRAGNRIAERRIAAHDQIRNALVQREGGLVLKSEVAARRVIHRLSGQEDIAEEGGARGLHGLRGNQVDPGAGDGVGDDVVGDRETGDAGSGDRQRVELMQRRRGVAHKELVARAEVVIEAEAALVVVIRSELGGFEYVGADVGQRIQFLRQLGDRALHVTTGSGSRERLAGELVDERNGLSRGGIGESGEIACSLRGGGHDSGLCLARGIALPFVVEEEEILVLADRSAQRGAVLIAVQRFGLGGEEVARVHGVVPEELVDIAVKIVASRLGDYRCGRAAGIAILGGSVQRENAELIHRVHGHAQSVSAIHAVHVAGAIEQIVVRFRPLPVDRVGLAAARDAARLGQAGSHGCDSGLQQAELRQVASVQGKIDRLLFGNHVAESLAGVHGYGLAGDADLGVPGWRSATAPARTPPGRCRFEWMRPNTARIPGPSPRADTSPMGRSAKWNAPWRDERTVRVRPVCALWTLTSAFDTSAEAGSMICPSRVPMGACAWTSVQNTQTARREY